MSSNSITLQWKITYYYCPSELSFQSHLGTVTQRVIAALSTTKLIEKKNISPSLHTLCDGHELPALRYFPPPLHFKFIKKCFKKNYLVVTPVTTSPPFKRHIRQDVLPKYYLLFFNWAGVSQVSPCSLMLAYLVNNKTNFTKKENLNTNSPLKISPYSNSSTTVTLSDLKCALKF